MEKEQLVPKEVLDRALGQEPGVGLPIEFGSIAERDAFRWRLYAAMGADARRSRREDDGADPGWGRHRWGAVRIERLGATALWIGRTVPVTVGAAVTLDKARAAGHFGVLDATEEGCDGNDE